MTLYEIVGILKQIALTQPNVKSATDGSVYDVMNTNPSVKYNVVHFSQTKHITDEETDTYGFNIFYISRLEDSLEDNRLQIQSIGKEILDNILRTFCENWGIDYPEILFYPFTQKFADLCAGMYCKVEIIVPKEIICADDYTAEVVPGSGIKLQDVTVTITQNGLRVITPAAEYDGIGEVRIVTDVPQTTAQLQYKEVEYTENGEYVVRPDQDYDGLTDVAITVNVPATSDRYDEGYADGEAAQKAKLVSTAFTTNGEYSREDGYSAITVNVPQTGSTINNQTKNLNVSSFFSWNSAASVYEIEVPVDVVPDSGYTGLDKVSVYGQVGATEAIAYGEEEQKAKLASTSFTENNTYTRADGWSSITVNVPQTGYTPEDLERAYQEGYEDGLNDCGGWDHKATGLSIIVADTIIGSGQASYSATPRGAVIDPVYSSNDTSKATIDPNTGAITVLQNGTVRFCVTDSRTSLQSCKNVNVLTAGTQYNELTFVYETTGANQTNVLFYGTAQDDNAYFYKFYNAIVAMSIDGVSVQKSSSNISSTKPYKRYLQTFPTAGRHTVKYYMSKEITDANPAGLVLSDLIFADNLQEMHLVEANIGSGYQVLGNGAFQGTEELTAVTIPNSVSAIGPYTFEYSGIKSITIPNGVTQLITDQQLTGYGVFNSCTSLTSATIGTGVSAIPKECFSGCSALKTLTMNRTTPPTLATNALSGCTSLQHIYVPANSVNAYKAASGWSQYANIIQAMP